MTNITAGANSIPRATGLIIVEVRNSNPNGDPERDGAPRRRRGDIGEISPVFKFTLPTISGCVG